MMKNSFEPFFLKYYPFVKSFALKLLKSEEEAEDVAQDIFLKLYENPEYWLDRQINEYYLFTMTKNHVFNILKRRAVFNKFINSNDSSISAIEENTPEGYVVAQDISKFLNDVIEKMPEQRRCVFKLNKLEKMSVADIADKMNLSKRTIERHIYLAVKELKKVFIFSIITLSI